MILLEQATEIVLNEAVPMANERIDFRQALGRILAEEIISDTDMPPFDKSAVDGYACRMEDLPRNLVSVETIAAGVVPKHTIGPGTCSKIMTGAMVPQGADCVIMVEDTEESPPETIHFNGEKTSPNICFRGEDIKAGETVLNAGTLIRPQEIAVLASTGHVLPLVSCRPKVAVITTGDELVHPSSAVSGATIRDSNSFQLEAQCGKAGAIPFNMGIVPDHPDAIRKVLQEALEENDMVLLTGGVSMGDYDYVPEIMLSAGIRILFRTIAIQPGKPTVFGKIGNKTVFGLPGNPVSSFVLFELLVKPLILKMTGWKGTLPMFRLPLGADFKRRKSERKALIPVRIQNNVALPVDYNGSAHINAYTSADGIISMEIGVSEMKKGSLTDVRPV